MMELTASCTNTKVPKHRMRRGLHPLRQALLGSDAEASWVGNVLKCCKKEYLRRIL